jgi:hypothetical protein
MGATGPEIGGPIPGDELHGDTTFVATRAITIDGEAEEISPGLIQMGWGRAGFYGYHRTHLATLPIELLTERADHIAVREILQGLKARAEGPVEPFAVQITALVVFLAAALVFAVGPGLLLFGPLDWRTWLTSLAAGFV